MCKKKYVSDNGLSHFLSRLQDIFGSKSKIETSRSALDTYVLNIDYSELGFDTGVSDAVLGIGKLGTMVLGKKS